MPKMLIDLAASDNFCVDRTTSQLLGAALRFLRALHAQAEHSLRLRRPHPLQPDHRRMVDAQLAARRRIRTRSFLRHLRQVRTRRRITTLPRPSPPSSTALPGNTCSISNSCTRPTAVPPRKLGMQLGWNDDFAKMREQLLAGGLKEIAAATSKTLAEDDARARRN